MISLCFLLMLLLTFTHVIRLWHVGLAVDTPAAQLDLVARLLEVEAHVGAHLQLMACMLLRVPLQDVAAVAPAEGLLARILRDTVETFIVDAKIHLLGAVDGEVGALLEQGTFLLAQCVDLSKLLTLTVFFDVDRFTGH